MTKTLIPVHMVETLESDQLARDNLALEALRLATTARLVRNVMVEGIFDTFEDQTGIASVVNGQHVFLEGLYESAINSMALVSQAFQAASTPDTLRLYLLEKDGDPVALNVDLSAHGSRDGGVTWATGTLEEILRLSSGIRVLAADIDVSAQPDGQSAVYKITTANAKELQLHGAALTWS